MSTWRPIDPPSFWKRWLPECLHGPVSLCFKALCAGLAIFAIVASTYVWLSSKHNMKEVAELPSGTLFCDRNGEPLEVPGSRGRLLAKRAEIPDFMINALIAREDARFKEHYGIDLRGLIRATLRNLKDRKFTQGASTLSMQLARNTFDIREKSIHRKLLEITITLRLEANYSKDEIITHYLNRIYFGSGAYGIAQAARIYFDKDVSKLSDSECAMLAGIIRGPHLFSPLRNPEGAIEQRRQTLGRMKVMGMIDEATFEKLNKEPVRLAGEEQRESQTSYALLAVKRELEQVLDDESASLGGLKVTTTIDGAWQQRLERELTHAVEALEAEKSWQHPVHAKHQSGAQTEYVQYAAVTTETKTGATLALIGGRNFSHSRYDRSRAKRDLGSAFEPFVAAAAAESEKLVIAGKPIQTGRQVGTAEVQRIAKLCGLGGPFVETEDLYRGAASASPTEMAVGLATLANKGNRAKPFLILKIQDRNGEVLYQAQPRLRQKISRNAALDAVSVLRNHSGTHIFTGATASERDAWTLRLGPTGSTAIWIGFDQPTAIAREARLKSLLDEFVERLGND